MPGRYFPPSGGVRAPARSIKLEQLVYVSTATAPAISIFDVSHILADSMRNNPANNITGALAFTETRFIQALEGSSGSLDVLILKLTIDPRHHDLIFIDRAPLAERAFPDWSMIAPDFSPDGKARLAALLADEIKSMSDFQQLLLDMCAEA